MTEEEWLECTKPLSMLRYLEGKMTARKQRLFLGSCCHRIYRLLISDHSKELIEVSDRFADDQANTEDLQIACDRAEGYLTLGTTDDPHRQQAVCQAGLAVLGLGIDLDLLYMDVVVNAVVAESGVNPFMAINHPIPKEESDRMLEEFFAQCEPAASPERSAQAHLIRDIFNPFHTVTLDPCWLNFTVTALAQRMYDTRDFSAMPILADALQDANCDNPQILEHCRGPHVHVRGCWVIDGCLNKT